MEKEKVESQVIAGRGYFALTDQNIKSVTKNVIEYKHESVWRWSMSDTIGITMKGEKTKKHEELMNILSERTDEDSITLYSELKNLEIVPEDQLIRHHRGEKKTPVENVPVETVPVDAEHSSNEISKQAAKNARRRAARMAKRSLV